MTWTYTTDFTIARNKIRFMVGDTDTNDQLVSDEEIAFALTQFPANINSAAGFVCRSISAKLARLVDTKIESVSVNYSQRAQQYMALSAKFDKDASSGAGAAFGAPVVGGISVSEMQAVEEDTDRVKPKFKQGMLDNPDDNSDELERGWV